MNYTKIMLGGIVALSSTAFAMPTSEQTKKVEPLVVDLMRDDQAALKSGKKTRVEVAESAMSLADQAESEAAKLLLMKGAFNLYVRAGEFDKAIETLQSLQAAIPDIPPSNMANIIETSLRSVPRKNGGQLYRLLDETKTRMRYTNEAASLEKSVKKTPADRTLRLKLAEHYAYLGKWDLALENFVAVGGKVSVIAKSERDGEEATEKIADFWWDYPNGKADELVRGFRVHAAKLYEDAIAAGAVTGLNKVQAERRIEEAKSFKDNIFDVTESASKQSVLAKSATGARQVAQCAKVQLWDGGPYWADMNIGAKKPWECGYYFWWGDTIGYKRENDAWVASDGSSSGFKFGEAITPTYDRPLEILQNEGWITADNELGSKHDAAQAHWGGEWRLPTQQELEELKNRCDWKWTTMKGVNGYVICGRGAYASASIFLPAAGEGYGNALNDVDAKGQYWASVPNAGKFCSWRLELNSSDYVMGKGGRSYGRTVRPVQGFTRSATTRQAARTKSMPGAQPDAEDPKKYCVIDISTGSDAKKYPVSYMAEEPVGGWTDEYKGRKIVLRKIPAGEVVLDGGKNEKFEKEFYAGVFEITQMQLELVTGKTSWDKGHVMYGFNRPAVNVSFEMIRGKGTGMSIDKDSFIGLLRRRTGLNIDLPTVAEWIYVGRAGTTTMLNNGSSNDEDLKTLGRYKDNKNDGKGGYNDGPSAVGMYIPNKWGIYDIHGNVSEWCLDNGKNAPIRNPKWGEDKVVEKQRVVMGRHWDYGFSRDQYSGWTWPTDAKKWYIGFRIVADVK